MRDVLRFTRHEETQRKSCRCWRQTSGRPSLVSVARNLNGRSYKSPWFRSCHSVRSLAGLLLKASVKIAAEVQSRTRVFASFEESIYFRSIDRENRHIPSEPSFEFSSLLGSDLDAAIAANMGIPRTEFEQVERDLQEAITTTSTCPPDDGEGDAPVKIDRSPAASASGLISYALGVFFGRWDVRLCLDDSLVSTPADVFDLAPMPPVGMLVGPDGNPATIGKISSEEWLSKARLCRVA